MTRRTSADLISNSLLRASDSNSFAATRHSLGDRLDVGVPVRHARLPLRDVKQLLHHVRVLVRDVKLPVHHVRKRGL